MLLIMGRYPDALREYEAVQQTEPRRFRAVYGAARAAELLGDREVARRHYSNLLQIAARAQPGLAELEHTRAFLGR
jgi:uncharacterized protein HemY